MDPKIASHKQILQDSEALIAKRQKCEKLLDWVTKNPCKENQWIFCCVCKKIEKIGKSYPDAKANVDTIQYNLFYSKVNSIEQRGSYYNCSSILTYYYCSPGP